LLEQILKKHGSPGTDQSPSLLRGHGALWFVQAGIWAIGLFLMALLVIPRPCQAGEWDKTDKELFGTLSMLMAVDMFQTRYIYEHDDFSEENPIIEQYFPHDKVYAYFALSTLGAYVIADQLGPGWRKSFLRFLCGLEIGVTQQNTTLGIRFSF
jgi:hypothetical protein